MGISIQAIRSSFEIVKPLAKDVADRFYQNLFHDYPEAKELFAGVEMQKQKTALIGSLVTAVENLENPDTLTRFLLALGERHVRYGAEDIHYDWVGATLLKTFGEFLGEHWTDELQQQWAMLYEILADAMKAGAKNASKPVHRLHAVHKDDNDRETSMSHKKNSTSNIAPTLTSSLVLPEGLRDQIRSSVQATVLELIKVEVKNHFLEELKRLEKMSGEELVRLAS